ncbi:MAG: DNA translocase FtsK 4TM domain-containing protein, partial [Patescibacteria group bacterium]
KIMVRRRRRKYYYNNPPRPRQGAYYQDPYEPIGLDLAPDTKRGIAIVLFLVIAVISGLGILEMGGSFGQLITKILKMLFGSAAFAAPLIFFGVSVSLFLGSRLVRRAPKEEAEEQKQTTFTRTYLGATLFVLALTGTLHLFEIRKGAATAFDLVKEGLGGGYLGVFTSFPLHQLMGFEAALVVLIALLLISLLVAFDMSLHEIFRLLLRLFSILKKPKGEKDVSAKPEPIKINTMQDAGFAVKTLPKRPLNLADLDEEIEEEMFSGRAKKEEEKPVENVTPTKLKKGNWKLPPTDILEPSVNDVQSGNIEAHLKIIKKTLADFGITVEMGEVNVGPTVTQFTFRPAVGVRLAQIIARQDDLALALAAPSIRIEAPIPGRSLVGVEVPNRNTSLVCLRELIESEQFTTHSSSLAFVLGRDVAGHPMIADLEKMPHLLVAGSTGSGKTVCLNTILTSFLYRNSPSELRFIVIDPKRVDLTLYSGIPHLLTPVVTDHKQAVNALKWSVAEMDRRYTLLSESGKRNIQEYNAGNENPLPFLVIIVDELAQLMSIAKNDVETTIVRLAQMSRAVGLHLILATQRPSVDVITGLIKANIASRIAFMVASQVDSRTILDMAGAENLLGRGDMLYMAADLPMPKRIQSAFISTKELQKVLNFLKDQAGPVEYEQEIINKVNKAAGSGGGDDDEADDDMINAAIEEIRRARKASASLLQRRLSVGYARAARILDILEQRGMIGPPDGAKPREVYIESEDDGFDR